MSRFLDLNEKPLDQCINDGGYVSIFKTIGCIGDSLSSGEFEVKKTLTDPVECLDMPEYSWGQMMAKKTGSTVYNFSCGGLTAKRFITDFADANDCWNPQKICQAYILAFGVNDILIQNQELGSVQDLCEDYTRNKDTFAGWYGRIVRRYKEIQPDAKFFFVTMASDGSDSSGNKKVFEHAQLLQDLSQVFSNSYVIDIAHYGEIHDADFYDAFYMGGHMSPAGYVYVSKVMISYIDYIIRHNAADFKQVAFIGKNLKNATVPIHSKGLW